MYIDIGHIVSCGSEFYNFRIFRTQHRKWGIWKLPCIAKIPANAHNSNNNNNNNNNNNSNNNNNNVIIIVIIIIIIITIDLTI